MSTYLDFTQIMLHSRSELNYVIRVRNLLPSACGNRIHIALHSYNVDIHEVVYQVQSREVPEYQYVQLF